MDPIAERELTYRAADTGQERVFAVKIFAPTHDGQCWACRFEMGAPAPGLAAETEEVYGEDSLQALVMALHAIQALLTVYGMHGQVRWLGEPVNELLLLPQLAAQGAAAGHVLEHP